VSVFGYGTSLYLGWMMWRSRRGYLLIGKYLADLVNGMLGRIDPETVILRTERPRAMREAVHAACREGLYVAIQEQNVPVAFGFPHGLPPIDGTGPVPPAPPGPSVPRGPDTTGAPAPRPLYQAADQRPDQQLYQPGQRGWPTDTTQRDVPPQQPPHEQPLPPYPPMPDFHGSDHDDRFWHGGDAHPPQP
jgi:hypothetical protein